MIKLANDTISPQELFDLAEWIKVGDQLTKGPLTLEFEQKFADYMGTRHAVYVNSGSAANLVALYGLLEGGFLRNSIAIAPAVSWVTTVSPLLQLGFQTHLCDCDINDLGLDIEHFEYLCKTYKPAVAFLVHVLGHSNKMDEIVAICEQYDVMLIEDSCEALGSQSSNGKLLGSIGRAGTFSFYYGHHISTIEGGMVVCDDNDLYNTMLSVRSHGWSRDLDPEFQSKLEEKYKVDEFRELYTFYYPGFNLRSTDLQAFIGLSQINKIEEVSSIRERNFQLYAKMLGQYFIQSSNSNRISSFAYGTLVANRLETFEHLKQNDIECRPLICGNIGRHPFWIEKFGECRLMNADLIHDYGIYLPNHANLSEEDVCHVSKIFKEVAEPLEHL